MLAKMCQKGEVFALLAILLGRGAFSAFSQTSLPVYSDHLLNGFQDWGWATHNYANTSPLHSGTNSISVNAGPYQGLQFYHPDLNSSLYSAISFWIYGGANEQLQVYGLAHVGASGNVGQTTYALPTLVPNTWQQFVIPLASLGVADKTNWTGFVIQSRVNATLPTFYLDDIQVIAAPAPAEVHISVDASHNIRTADSRWFGVNTAIWDGNLDTPTTISLLQELGTRVLRGPGGSTSDEYHWVLNKSLNNTWAWASSFANFVHVATNIGAQAIITVNYGTGSSNEAAAWVAYANGTTANQTALGTDALGTNWQTVAYWASLRAATKLAKDDGKNFLRLSRAAPFGFKYWEIGNECYGTWETDSNRVPPFAAHDGWTYANRARDYFHLMKLADPTIEVGVVLTPGEDSSVNGNTNHPALNPRTGQAHYGWTPVVLATLKAMSISPDFGIYHFYAESTDAANPSGTDSDPSLLQASVNWANDSADLRQQLTDYFGASGTNIELLCTENNSDSGAQGKQSTSLVNGIYYADSSSRLMQTEFNSHIWWDLRNGTDTSGWFDPSLYGWRTFGDLGLINNLNTRLPAFYTGKLMQRFIQPGETILGASSDYLLLTATGSRHANGSLSLLVLNKNITTNLNAQVALNGFMPNSTATVMTYGIPQDEATRTNGPAAMQDLATNSFSGAATSFSYSFPPLSMTVFTLAPAAPKVSIAASSGQFVVQVQGQQNVRYVLQKSTDLRAWSNVATNTPSGTTWSVTNSINSGTGTSFWRAVWGK